MLTEKKLQAIDLSCIRQEKQIFAGISFQLQPGEALFIHGRNGCGKSSLLRLLTGLAAPATGKVCWQGKRIQEPAADYRAHLHYVGHQHGIKLGLSVEENLRLTGLLNPSIPSHRKDYFLQQLQLAAQQNTLAKYLSAGQKRRLALAKLFIYPKTIWILDEPLTALDETTQTFFILQLIEHLHQGGISIISSHHAISLPLSAEIKSSRLDLC